MSLFDLGGKTAIITGSSRGIGRAIADELASHGAQVVISSRDQHACDEAAAAINAGHGPGRAMAVAASISSKAALESLFSRAEDRFVTVDILVCNAASNPHAGSLDGISDEQFRKILDNNILSNHWLIQLALPRMRAQREGSIIVISSTAGLPGSHQLGGYAVSKAADFQLVRKYAVENGPHNIRVNAIAPGLVRTDFARSLLENGDLLDSALARTPLRRVGQPRDIAGAAVYLASSAASWMTGQVLIVDGGVNA